MMKAMSHQRVHNHDESLYQTDYPLIFLNPSEYILRPHRSQGAAQG